MELLRIFICPSPVSRTKQKESFLHSLFPAHRGAPVFSLPAFSVLLVLFLCMFCTRRPNSFADLRKQAHVPTRQTASSHTHLCARALQPAGPPESSSVILPSSPHSLSLPVSLLSIGAQVSVCLSAVLSSSLQVRSNNSVQFSEKQNGLISELAGPWLQRLLAGNQCFPPTPHPKA